MRPEADPSELSTVGDSGDMSASAPRVERRISAVAGTGERFVISQAETEVELEHIHRYLVAASLCENLAVLDAASGEGYGSALLSQVALQVVGVEIDPVTVAAAQAKYPRSNLAFHPGDVTRLDFPNDWFHRVVSFETLEHVDDHGRVLDEFRRVLKSDGILMISTPEKTIYNRHLAAPNPFHVCELTAVEFKALLSARFKHVAIYGQRVVFGSMFIPQIFEKDLDVLRRDPSQGTISSNDAYDGSMYLIALCSDHELPRLGATLYEGGIPQNAVASLLGGISERDQKIVELLRQIDELGRTP